MPIIFQNPPEMQKDNLFTRTRFKPKLFYPKKCVNYDKSNSRQNSVKGPKDPLSAKKCQKVTKSFKIIVKCHQKAQNRDITNFLDKTA